MRIKGAIFDLDGTLLDSMSIWNSLAEEYLRSLGKEPRENLSETFKEMSLMQSALYYQNEYGISKSTEEIIDGINDIIRQFYLHKACLKTGIKEFLGTLADHGVKMCVATTVERYFVEQSLIRCNVREYFGEIFTCGEVGHGKDEPVIYEHALQYLGTAKADTVVFEDAVHAVRTAKNAGFIVAGVFDASESRQKAVLETSDYYIKRFDGAAGIFL